MSDDFELFDDEEFSPEDEIDSSFFVYKTLIEEGYTEREAMKKSGLTLKQIKELYEKELAGELEEEDELDEKKDDVASDEDFDDDHYDYDDENR